MALSYQKLNQFDLLNDLADSIKPDNLGPVLDFVGVTQEIQAADRFIRDLPSYPMSTDKIIRNELVSAIGSTLAIEGISTDREQINEAIQKGEADSLRKEINRKEQEIINSQNVYRYILKTVRSNREDKFIFTIEHISDIHRLFTEKIPYLGNTPGVYRNTGASFGDPRKVSLCSSYGDIYISMKYFIEWLNIDGGNIFRANVIAKAIMAHYYLTEIHPFGDGNGRTARAVEAMILYVNGMNEYCFWSLANFWSAHRNEYISHLGNIRETCNPYDFMMWGLRGYLGEILRIKGLVLKKVKQLMFRDYVTWLNNTNKDRPPSKRINDRMFNLLMMLTDLGRLPLNKFKSHSFYKTLYLNVSEATQSRDFTKITKTLALASVTQESGEDYIEPNYEILRRLEYKI